MRVLLLSTYRSRGDIEPTVGLAVRLRAPDAQVRVCAPPDFAEQPARVCARPGWSPRCPRDALAAGGMMPAGVWL